jgi:hypothetical protein
MENKTLTLSINRTHYQIRCQQRGIPLDVSEICMRYGRVIHQGKKRIAYFIGHKEVYQAQKEQVDITFYENCIYIESLNGCPITTIRSGNFRRLKKISFKP